MNKEIAVFAATNYRNQMQKFGIKTDDRRRHMYLIGKTGMGKSTVLENMIIGDIRAGKGLAVVDPHGDLAEKVLGYIPPDRINDVIYFNPADMEYPIAFNVLEQVAPEYRHLVASGLIGVFKKLWADSWGPRLEYILRNAILAILDYPGATLLAVTRMLSDKAFRKKVIAKVKDPVVKAFWLGEFASYADKFATEAVSPIQNKVGQFLSTSLIRNVVGQVKSSIDLRTIMDESKILILNLSKGRIGEDNSLMLGSMMITKIQLAAMGRVNTPEKDRVDFYLYIDEFQNFVTESFANILSEARKYKLNLIMAHQYIEQLGDTVKAAVFGNVGTMVVFRVGAADAEELVREFTPVFTEEDIVNIPKYEFYIKLMIDGISSDPFSARGLPPFSEEDETGGADKVIKVSRERYAKKKEQVEEKIARWLDIDSGVDTATGKKNNDGPGTQKAKDDIYKFSAKCSRCGIDTKIPFEPDGVRPVYCKDCLSELSKEKKEQLENKTGQKRDEFSAQAVKASVPAKEDAVNKSKPKPVSLNDLRPTRPTDTNIRQAQNKNMPFKDLAKKFENSKQAQSSEQTKEQGAAPAVVVGGVDNQQSHLANKKNSKQEAPANPEKAVAQPVINFHNNQSAGSKPKQPKQIKSQNYPKPTPKKTDAQSTDNKDNYQSGQLINEDQVISFDD